MNALKTSLNREFALRLAGVCLVLVALAVWSVYDGRIAFPRENTALETVRPVLLADNRSADEWLDVGTDGESALAKAFAEKGFKVPSRLIRAVGECRLPPAVVVDREKKRLLLLVRLKQIFASPVRTEFELNTQYVQAAVCALLALLVAGAILRCRRNVVFADGTGLSGPGIGPCALPYTALAGIDRARWDSKGIVTLEFGNGRRIKLDAWHHTGVKEILERIDAARPDLVPHA